jgi:hypothetical protein
MQNDPNEVKQCQCHSSPQMWTVTLHMVKVEAGQRMGLGEEMGPIFLCD